MTNITKTPRMLLYLDNFRGFQNTTVNIMDVNFLVGENSSGKTSFLRALNLISSQSFWLPAAFANQERTDFGHFDDAVSINSKNKRYFSIGFCETSTDIPRGKNQTAKTAVKAFLFTYRNKDGIPELHKITYNAEKRIITVFITDKITKYKVQELDKPLTIEDINSSIFEDWSKIHHETKPSGFTRISIDIKLPLVILFTVLEQETGNDKEKTNSMFRSISLMDNLAWIAPIRTKPRRTYDEAYSDFSPEGEHTPYLVRKILDSGTQSTKFVNFVKKFGRESGLFKEVRVHKFGKSVSSPFELDIILDSAALNISNVGYGVSQALPVIVEIFVRRKNTWFAIQQPEVHLHPKAQASFGDAIFQVSEVEDKRFLIETHSDFTIDRYRICRRENTTTKSSQVLFFERKDGKNIVNEIEIDANGDLSENQPESYRKFFLREELRVLGVL